jgi:hypothetical protein
LRTFSLHPIWSLALMVFLLSGGLLLGSPSTSPLSPHQRDLLMHEVNFFADRYDPGLTVNERSKITTDVEVIEGHERQHTLFRLSLGFGLFAVASLGALFWWGLQFRNKSHPLNRRLRTAGFLLLLMIVLNASTACVMTWRGTRRESQMEIGGAVDHGTIQIPVSELLKSDDELLADFDHELTHLFGVSRFHKIQRDSWLAYAYQFVLVMNRGGTASVQRNMQIRKGSTNVGMYYFYQGVKDAATSLPFDQPGEAEAALMRTVNEFAGAIDPDAPSDGGTLSSFEPNWSYAIGLAGVAWVTANGDCDAALKYLDDRGNGMSAADAVRDVQGVTKDKQGSWNEERQRLMVEAMLFLAKVGLRST